MLTDGTASGSAAGPVAIGTIKRRCCDDAWRCCCRQRAATALGVTGGDAPLRLRAAVPMRLLDAADELLWQAGAAPDDQSFAGHGIMGIVGSSIIVARSGSRK